MKVYFVRHGESEANAKNIRQKDGSPLTELGRKQAQFVGKRLANHSIDLIIASPFTRTHQTAEIINQELKKEIIFSDLFVERRKPLVVNRLPVGDPEGDRIMDEVLKNFYVPDWHYAEEENFEDLHKRALSAVHFLEEQTAENIAVVTHGIFLRHILGAMLFGEQYSPKESKGLYHFRTQNTGVSLCEYYPEEATSEWPGWRVNVWNDQAHLE